MDNFELTYIPGKVDRVKREPLSLEDTIRAYSGRMEDNRLYLHCVCDGTYIFLSNMVCALNDLGCTDIKTNERILDERETPEGKPWCNCLFEANGVLPKQSGD